MKIEYDLNIRDTIVWDLIVLGIGLGDKCVLDVSVWDIFGWDFLQNIGVSDITRYEQLVYEFSHLY